MRERAGKFLLLLIIISSPAAAQESGSAFLYEFPLFEVPYNASHDGRFPSMNQSLAITKDFYQAIHYTFSLAQDDYPVLSILSSGALNAFLLGYLPGGNAWLHEEWHRSVMGQYGINSFNDVYKMDIGASSIAVSHVSDSDLRWLKANHPADMVRLSEAGIEGEYEWIRASREEFFFSGRSTRYERFAWLLSAINSSWYIYICTTKDADTETDAMNEKESDIDQRDFVGLDFTAWVYDLFRPDEPYENRGVHPLGNGYDRYIRYSDLTNDEKNYLKRQFYLSLMNFISPQFYGIDRFSSDGLFWNVAFMHYLTSFGSSSECELLASYGPYNAAAVIRLYQNESLALPGLEVRMMRLRMTDIPFFADISAAAWLQPRDQLFHTKRILPGGSLAVKVSYPITEWFEMYADASVKSQGWQAGHVSLDPSAEGRLGCQLVL